MPRTWTHCAISKKRTGYNFKRLHEWIDEHQKEDGYNHRLKRHAYNDKEEKQIKKFWDKEKGWGWGNKAVIEWLFHIALDNLDTAFKKSKKAYKKRTFNHIQFGLSENGYIHTKFGKMAEDDLNLWFEGNSSKKVSRKSIIGRLLDMFFE